MKILEVKTIVLMGLFIAMSFVGAMVSLTGYTIALDAMPAFLGALMLGPVYGGIIGLIGHLLSAGLRGFPMSLPIHMIIGVMMFISCSTFGWIYKKNTKKMTKLLAIVDGILLNGPVALGITAVVLSFSMGAAGAVGVFTAMFLPLVIGAAVNVILAFVVYELLKDRTKYL